MKEAELGVEKASREMGEMAWEHFTSKITRPHCVWRLVVKRNWSESHALLISEWFDCETKLQERLEHHAKSDTEIIAVDGYEITQENAALRAEVARLTAHNETLIREHKEMAAEVAVLHVEIENVQYAADVGLTEEENRADRWVGHARRLFKIKCEYSQKCRELTGQLARLTAEVERLGNHNDELINQNIDLASQLADKSDQLEELRGSL